MLFSTSLLQLPRPRSRYSSFFPHPPSAGSRLRIVLYPSFPRKCTSTELTPIDFRLATPECTRRPVSTGLYRDSSLLRENRGRVDRYFASLLRFACRSISAFLKRVATLRRFPPPARSGTYKRAFDIDSSVGCETINADKKRRRVGLLLAFSPSSLRRTTEGETAGRRAVIPARTHCI